MIYHIVEQAVWEAQQALPDYQPAAFVSEGFVHCSNDTQVIPTAGRYYQGRKDLLVLEVDPTQLLADTRYENLLGGVEKFPHVYGVINKSAIQRVLTLDDFAVKSTAFLSDERCFWHSTGEYSLVFPVGGWVQPPAGGGHAESPESKRRFENLLKVSGLAGKLDCHSGAALTEEALLRVHTADYLHEFKTLSDANGGAIHPVAPFRHGSYDIAALSAGLATQAVAGVLSGRNQNSYALSRPPGHHCLAGSPMGFCLLANIALAIEAAKADFGVGRIAVVDWDAHHGNGTQSIFYSRNDVLTISLHQENAYPPDSGAFAEQGEGCGEGYNLNINMLPGAGGELYDYAFERLVLPALQNFKPELIIVACGFDAGKFDPLARLNLVSEDYRRMTQQMVWAADELCDGRLVMVHEGGYAESYVPFCGLAVMEVMSGQQTEVEDKFAQAWINPRFNQFHRGLIDEIASAWSGV